MRKALDMFVLIMDGAEPAVDKPCTGIPRRFAVRSQLDDSQDGNPGEPTFGNAVGYGFIGGGDDKTARFIWRVVLGVINRVHILHTS